MKAQCSRLYNAIIRNCCDEEVCGHTSPDAKCNCEIFDILNQIRILDEQLQNNSENSQYCQYCENSQDMWWMPETGGLRVSKYCPECGRQIKES